MIRRYTGATIIAFFVIVLTILLLPNYGAAYNKSWDQGHKCVHPNEGGSTWGRYDYDGNRQGEYPTKDCCIKYCKICPVYANTGRLQKTFTDLSVPGVGPSLTITRTYQSQDWANTLLGHGWMFNFGKRLIVTRDNDGEKIIVVRRGTGEQNFFREHPDGTLELLADYGVTYDLINNGDGTYTIANKDGSVQSVNADGKTTRIVDKNGNELSFAYDAVGCLARITNASGNYVDFQLGPSGKIASISDNLGRTIAYGYDTNANLTSSTDPMGNTTQYTYDSENRLTSILDPRGNTVLAVTYDGFQPPRIATFTEKGETWTITYYADRTVKRDSSGNTWSYYFNDVGIIERVIDPLGNETEQSHNYVTSTSMEWEEDANGNRTSYTYDADGNISSKTNPLGNTLNYTYAAGTDRRITETNPSGVVTRYEYDGYGNLIRRIRDSGGSLENTTTYTYDSEGNKTSQTDPQGNITTYQYDAGGNLIRITDPLGNVTAYTYDSRGNKLTETNALGNTTTYTYDLMDRRISVTDALGNTTNYAYDENGKKTSETDANGNTTTYAYDAYNRLTQMTDPLGNTTSFTYDSRDNRTSMTNANGNTTTYTYDILDRLIRETYALGEQTNFTYDAAGNALTVTDACGNTTTYAYDEANRKISETNAAGETTTYTYDAAGNQTMTTLPNGNVIARTYDSLGRLTELPDTLGLITGYVYDLAGRLLNTTDALGNVTAYAYDALGRTVQITDPLGNSAAYTYDAVGRLLTTTDREGNTTGYTYDSVSRIISETDPLGNSTTYSYDSVGSLVSIADALGNTANYSYDALNRLIQQTYADSTTRSFTFDAVGNMISRTDQNGQVTSYTYDALNRPRTIDYPGTNDSTFTYDCAGSTSTANNANATISFSYDNIYRLTQSVQNGQTVAYSHDTAAGTKTITYPGGRLIREIRNLRGLLTRVEDVSAQPIVQYTYDAADRVQTKTFLNGVAGNFNYNANGWTSQLTYDRGGSQILGFEYGFDNEGNRLYARKLHDTGNSEQYIYDAKYRLTQFRRGMLDSGGTVATPVTQTAYNLDALGNWTSKTTDGVTENRTHNNMNELAGIDGSPLTYDNNGNLIDDGTNAYEYEYENRLVRVIRQSDSVVLGEYEYDALGRRVEEQASGATTAYYYDENRVIEEQVGGATEATYVYGVSIDEAVSTERSDETYYYHNNSLGSVVALTDASGSIAEQYRYDAYGDPVPASSGLGNPYMFTGRRLDTITGLYYYRNRYYSNHIGRFTTRDPLGELSSEGWRGPVSEASHIMGLNLYLYANGNPINLDDPMGLLPCIGNWLRRLFGQIPAMGDIASPLKALCEEPCCKCEQANGKWEPCSPEKCEEEATKIADAIKATWNAHWGLGNCCGSHNRGGYLCWDWSSAFERAAKNVASECWDVAEDTVDHIGSNIVHFFIVLNACKDSSESCKVMIDDGWGTGYVHYPPWPYSEGYVDGSYVPYPSQWCSPHIRQ